MPEWLSEAKAVDTAVYGTIAAGENPSLDVATRGLSRAADHSKLWFATAAALAILGGSSGRLAARKGLVSLGIASAFANFVAKPLTTRRRPARLRVVATLVGYSRIHTGVHYPRGRARRRVHRGERGGADRSPAGPLSVRRDCGY